MSLDYFYTVFATVACCLALIIVYTLYLYYIYGVIFVMDGSCTSSRNAAEPSAPSHCLFVIDVTIYVHS